MQYSPELEKEMGLLMTAATKLSIKIANAIHPIMFEGQYHPIEALGAFSIIMANYCVACESDASMAKNKIKSRINTMRELSNKIFNQCVKQLLNKEVNNA